MKKTFPALILTVLLMGFLVSISAIAAEEKIPDCCKLSKDVSLDDVDYKAGIWVGGEDCEGANLKGAGKECPASGNANNSCRTKKWGLICMISSVKVITAWIFDFLMVFVGVMVILGAFNIMTSAGSPEKTKSGRNYILYAAIGMLVGLLAKAIPALLESILGR